MLALSDQQLKTVQTAAALLPPAARDTFMRSIAGRLVNIATPSDADIAAAASFVLSTRRSFTRGTPRGLFGSIGLIAVHS
jgi:hypothetical protein